MCMNSHLPQYMTFMTFLMYTASVDMDMVVKLDYVVSDQQGLLVNLTIKCILQHSSLAVYHHKSNTHTGMYVKVTLSNRLVQ
jgi:hypothetical protein